MKSEEWKMKSEEWEMKSEEWKVKNKNEIWAMNKVATCFYNFYLFQ